MHLDDSMTGHLTCSYGTSDRCQRQDLRTCETGTPQHFVLEGGKRSSSTITHGGLSQANEHLGADAPAVKVFPGTVLARATEALGWVQDGADAAVIMGGGISSGWHSESPELCLCLRPDVPLYVGPVETDRNLVTSLSDISAVFLNALSTLAWRRGGALANSSICAKESLVLEGIVFAISEGCIEILVLLQM